MLAHEFWTRGRIEAEGFLRDDLVHARRGGGGLWSGGRLGLLSVRGVAEGAMSNIGALARAAFGRTAVTRLPTQAADAAERFAFAQRYYRRSDADLQDLQDNKHRHFLLFVAIVIAL